MATKAELRSSYITAGWDIQPLPWQQVSADHLDRVKYDLDVVDPDGEFFTAQVVVTDDGGANESAVAKGRLAMAAETFEDAARAWLLTQETGQPSVFAYRLEIVDNKGESAEATMFEIQPAAHPDPERVTSQRIIVKRRSGTFSFLPMETTAA